MLGYILLLPACAVSAYITYKAVHRRMQRSLALERLEFRTEMLSFRAADIHAEIMGVIEQLDAADFEEETVDLEELWLRGAVFDQDCPEG